MLVVIPCLAGQQTRETGLNFRALDLPLVCALSRPVRILTAILASSAEKECLARSLHHSRVLHLHHFLEDALISQR
jgi:hypothetical protein